jgi:hypothetical protein
MSLLFFDGLSYYNDDILASWHRYLTIASTQMYLDSAAGRHNNTSIRTLGQGSESAGAGVQRSVSTTDHLIAGCAFLLKQNTYRAYDFSWPRSKMIVFSNSLYGEIKVYLSFNPRIKRFQIMNASNTVLTRSDRPVAFNTWYYIELRAKIHSTLGEVEGRINGGRDMLVTNIDTQQTANENVDYVSFFSDPVSMYAIKDIDICDMYICNTSGSVNTGFLGDVRVDHLYSTANGTTNDFVGSDGDSTDNFALVTESGASYVETSGVGNIDLYGMSDISGAPESIYGVQVTNLAEKTDAGPRGISNVIRTNSTNYSGNTYYPSYGSREYTERSIWEENPNTATAWTSGDIAALEAGIRLDT